jgi:inner membrane protein
MFIAHLSAGYLLTDSLQRRFKIKDFLLVGLVASILPDIDLFYFFFVDNRQSLHHAYWTHIPFDWLCIALVVFVSLRLFNQGKYYLAAIIFFANIFLHMLLDTIAGGIMWLYPFSQTELFLVTVPARFHPWYLNFVFHWTFLLEIALIVWSIVRLVNNRKRANLTP